MDCTNHDWKFHPPGVIKALGMRSGTPYKVCAKCGTVSLSGTGTGVILTPIEKPKG